MTPTSEPEKRPSFKKRVLMFTPRGELSTAAMQEIVRISSTVSATIFSPTPLHAHAPIEADALNINGTPFTVDAPSSGGSNSFDSFYEQSDTQLLPTSHEPPPLPVEAPPENLKPPEVSTGPSTTRNAQIFLLQLPIKKFLNFFRNFGFGWSG
jgi:hypothetical protein